MVKKYKCALLHPLLLYKVNTHRPAICTQSKKTLLTAGTYTRVENFPQMLAAGFYKCKTLHWENWAQVQNGHHIFHKCSQLAFTSVKLYTEKIERRYKTGTIAHVHTVQRCPWSSLVPGKFVDDLQQITQGEKRGGLLVMSLILHSL